MTRRRKFALWLFVVVAIAAVISLRWLLAPATLVPNVLALAGRSLGLEITASGIGDYRLRGTPQLVARDVVARLPGEGAVVLRAERIFISLPWSTLRARGSELNAHRVELDGPVLDVAALQQWLATRPSSKTPVPTLSKGIGIVRGRVLGGGWKIDNLQAQLQSLAPDEPMHMQVAGRYVADGLHVPVDVHATLTRPGPGAGVGVAGTLSLEARNWRLPSRVLLSAKLLTGKGIELRHAVLGASARYVAGANVQPFSLGIAGPLRFEGNHISLQPAGLSILGKDMIPTLQGSGDFTLAEDLRLHLDGSLASWPAAWPALPPPLGQSNSPLPFTLSYAGAADFSAVAALRLQRDASVFDGRFRLPEVMDWIDAAADGSPLPPVSGTIKSPRMEASGAVLEGVELQLDDPAIRAPGE